MKNSVAHIEHCYGCGVCSARCGHDAIEMRLDTLGFYRPEVDAKKCNDCGLCRKSCSYLDDNIAVERKPKEWFAGWSEDENTVASCSSGGVAYELAKAAINAGYTVIGVRYDVEKNRAEHVLCETIDALEQTKGSKYIQSYTTDAFKAIKKGKKYMVVGTPCQIDSLRRYMKMRRMEDDVVLVDFFCHGVPSYNMWAKYIDMSFRGKQTTSMKFRSKKNYATDELVPWHDSYVVTSSDVQGEKYQPSLQGHKSWFYYYFLGDLCLGKQCYEQCKYKMYNSSADIRIGDAWTSAYDDNEKGVSAVLVYSEIGKDLVSQMKGFHREEIELELLCEGQMREMPKEPKWYRLRLQLMRVPKLRFGHIEKLIEVLNKLCG